MPDLITHYVFSYLIASRVFSWRKSFIIAFIGLLPDLDALFRIHRWFTHSIFLTLISGLLLILVIYYIYPRYVKYVSLGILIYSVHLLMDIFTGPTPILWPLINISYSIYFDLNASVGVNGVFIHPYLKISGENPDFMTHEEVGGSLASGMGIISLIGLFSILLIEYILKSSKEENI